MSMLLLVFFFFFNDTATTEIYTLSLHDALPISGRGLGLHRPGNPARRRAGGAGRGRTSTPRLGRAGDPAAVGSHRYCAAPHLDPRRPRPRDAGPARRRRGGIDIAMTDFI